MIYKTNTNIKCNTCTQINKTTSLKLIPTILKLIIHSDFTHLLIFVIFIFIATYTNLHFRDSIIFLLVLVLHHGALFGFLYTHIKLINRTKYISESLQENRIKPTVKNGRLKVKTVG